MSSSTVPNTAKWAHLLADAKAIGPAPASPSPPKGALVRASLSRARLGLGSVSGCRQQCSRPSQDSEHWLWPLQETGLKVNQPASFAVQLNGARGVIDARVHTPSGAVEECYVSELESGELTLALPTHARPFWDGEGKNKGSLTNPPPHRQAHHPLHPPRERRPLY